MRNIKELIIKKFKKASNLNLAFLLMLIITALISGQYLRNTWNTSIDETSKRAIDIAKTAAALLNGDTLKKIDGVPEDIGTKSYENIKRRMLDLKDVSGNYRFAYIYTQRDGKIYFMVDSEPISSEDFSPPGQEYQEASDLDKEFFKESYNDGEKTERSTDRWGSWVSALVPMRDYDTGKIYAVFGLDYPTELWNNEAMGNVAQAGIIVCVIFLLIIAFYTILKKNASIKKSEKNLIEAQRVAHIGSYIIDLRTKTFKISKEVQRIFGISDEFPNNLDSWVELFHPDMKEKLIDYYTQVEMGKKMFNSEYKIIRNNDNEERWVHLLGEAEFDETNNPIILFGTIQDITPRKAAEEELGKKDKTMHAISQMIKGFLDKGDYYNTIPSGLKLIGEATDVDRVTYFEFKHDKNSNKRIASQRAEWCSYNVEPQINNMKLQYITDDAVDKYVNMLTQNGLFVCLVKNIDNGIVKTYLESQNVLSVLILPIFVKGYIWGAIKFDECKYEKDWSEVEISVLQVLAESISKAVERTLYEEELEFMSYHDSLTGLYNRRRFEIIFNEIDESGECPVSIIFGDVNGLKLLNDTYGYNCGDKNLIKIAEILKEECGESAFVARRGGDEFAAILKGVNYKDVCTLITRLKERYKQESTEDLMLNVSFGVATKTEANEDLMKVYHMAEDRMYTSKLLDGKSIRSTIIDNFRIILEEKTGGTGSHCERMSDRSEAIGKELGLQSFEIEYLKLLSLLHDIGKTAIPDSILLKPGRLTDEEMAIMKKHSEIGFRIANTMPELLPIADGILSHHERWDGKGYPQGLKGEEIPLISRIVALLDTYDAMTNDRPYRKALSNEEAIEEIKKCSGTQFDPDIVEVFIKTESMSL